MKTYEEKDALPHAATGDEWWQESVVVTWWDEAAGLGGFIRLGHEVGQGTATAWVGAITAGGRRFRYYEPALPLEDADREGDGFAVRATDGPVASALLEDGALRWRITRPGFEADMTVTDFHPMTNLWQLGAKGSLAEEFAPDHWEASGRLQGTVRLEGAAYDLDALCHRDHSWGTRKWNTVRTHRWVAGTVGPELSFCAITWYSTDGQLVKEAYVHRDGELLRADSVDVLAFVEIDGISCRGGRVALDLPGGTALGLDCTAVDGFVFPHRNVACVDTISRVRTSSGQTGFCDFETTHNSRDGNSPVTLAVGANLENGLSQRPGR
jgi:hypothetical protein